jgi:hypothetical protein
MPVPPTKELLSVDPEVLQILGVTLNQLAELTTGQFAALSFAKGIIWNVSAEGGRIKGLTITVEPAQQIAR